MPLFRMLIPFLFNGLFKQLKSRDSLYRPVRNALHQLDKRPFPATGFSVLQWPGAHTLHGKYIKSTINDRPEAGVYALVRISLADCIFYIKVDWSSSLSSTLYSLLPWCLQKPHVRQKGDRGNADLPVKAKRLNGWSSMLCQLYQHGVVSSSVFSAGSILPSSIGLSFTSCS